MARGEPATNPAGTSLHACAFYRRGNLLTIHAQPLHKLRSPGKGNSNSSRQPITRRTTMSTPGKRALSSLKDFTQAPNSSAALEKLLYGEDLNYDGLRKMLKNIGEEKPERLSKSQVTRSVERYIKSGTFTLNSIRRAVGVPQQDYEEEEEEEEEEVVVAKKPAAKAAKTNPSTTGTATTKGSGKKGAKAAASAAAAAAETERRSSGVFAYISNLFLPSKE